MSGDTNKDVLEGLRIERGSVARRGRIRLSWIMVPVLLVAGVVLALGPLRSVLFPLRVTTAVVTRVAATRGAVRTTASGYVIARRRAAISSRLSGRLESLLVDVGDRVEQGQLLGRLGQEDLVAAVAEARAALAQAQLAVPVLERRVDVARAAVGSAESRVAQADAAVGTVEDRLAEAERVLALEKGLLASGGSSQDVVDASRAERDIRVRELAVARAAVQAARAEVEQAKQEDGVLRAQIESARAGVRAAEASLQRAEALRADGDILAPFTGIVLRKEAEVGEMVSPVNAAGSTTRGAIVTLADFDSLEMEVDVIERDIGKVSEGLPCRIVLDSREAPYAGHVRQVVPTADRTRGTVQVKITFDALDEHVLPEMSGRVEFLDATAGAAVLGADRVLLDARALVADADGTSVYVVKGGVLTRTAIEIAGTPDDSGSVTVTAGLRGGEEVVLSPPDDAQDGVAVDPRPSGDER